MLTRSWRLGAVLGPFWTSPCSVAGVIHNETAGTFFPADGTLSLRAVPIDRTRLPKLTLRAGVSAGLRSFAARTTTGA